MSTSNPSIVRVPSSKSEGNALKTALHRELKNGSADLIIAIEDGSSGLDQEVEALRSSASVAEWLTLGSPGLTRAFRVRTEVLRRIPFHLNDEGAAFLPELVLQLSLIGARNEVLPFAGKKLSRPSFRSALIARLMGVEHYYDSKFDLEKIRDSKPRYITKRSPHSIHHFMREVKIPVGHEVLDVGGGEGESVGLAHANRGARVTSIDLRADSSTDGPVKGYRVDLDEPWLEQFPAVPYDEVFALDVLEHLKTPEDGASNLFQVLKTGGTLYASTGNIAFLSVRLMLLFGRFEYGRRGILDRTHKRLFTKHTFRRMLERAGFEIEREVYFGFTVSDFSPDAGFLARTTDAVLAFFARVWPGAFAYQMLFVCKKAGRTN